MLVELATLLSKNSDAGVVTFAMPINRLVVDLLAPSVAERALNSTTIGATSYF